MRRNSTILSVLRADETNNKQWCSLTARERALVESMDARHYGLKTNGQVWHRIDRASQDPRRLDAIIQYCHRAEIRLLYSTRNEQDSGQVYQSLS
jgi:hypothetical protein